MFIGKNATFIVQLEFELNVLITFGVKCKCLCQLVRDFCVTIKSIKTHEHMHAKMEFGPGLHERNSQRWMAWKRLGIPALMSKIITEDCSYRKELR